MGEQKTRAVFAHKARMQHSGVWQFQMSDQTFEGAPSTRLMWEQGKLQSSNHHDGFAHWSRLKK